MMSATASITPNVITYWTSATANENRGSTKKKSNSSTLATAAERAGLRPSARAISTTASRYAITTFAWSSTSASGYAAAVSAAVTASASAWARLPRSHGSAKAADADSGMGGSRDGMPAERMLARSA